MKIYFSESDRQNAQRIVLRNFGQFFEIPNWDSKENEQLLEEISDLKSKEAKQLLKLYINYKSAYDEWYQFYLEKMKIENQTGQEYVLNENDTSILHQLITKREFAFNRLKEQLNEFQNLKQNA